MRFHLVHPARLIAVMAIMGAPLAAQEVTAPPPAHDPSTKLSQVLPADIASKVLAIISDARSHGLAAGALEQRALKFAARGVAPADIERSVSEQAARQASAQQALESARGSTPTVDEIEAGAEAMREGADGSAVAALAKSAPSGRSLAVPLYVLGSLTSRGLPSDQALARVRDRLAAGASDSDLESLPAQAQNGLGNGGTPPGRGLGTSQAPGSPSTGRPAGGGPPSGVPANGGKAGGHTTGRPATKPGKP